MAHHPFPMLSQACSCKHCPWALYVDSRNLCGVVMGAVGGMPAPE